MHLIRMKKQNTFPRQFIAALLLISTAASLPTRSDARVGQGGRGGELRTVNRLPSKDKRWALVVGVDNYGLKGAVNDAKALKNALVRYAGFPAENVILLTSDNDKAPPDRANILSELDRLSRTVPADGLFLFSFSGHGKTIEDNAYLIPSDGRMTNIKRLMRDFSIDVTRIREAVEDMKVKQVVMLIDACRTRIEGQRGDGGEPLTPVISREFSFDETNRDVEAFVTLYATKISESAYEYLDEETGQWRGYFSKAVEEGLSGKAANERGEVTLAGLESYLETTVPTRSYRIEGVRQTPWKNSNGYKESELVLALVPKGGVAPKGNAAPKPSSAAGWAGFSVLAKRLSGYDFVGPFAGSLAPVKSGGKWGFVDGSGNLTVALKYEQVCTACGEFTPVSLNKKWGFVDGAGREVVSPKYDEVRPFSEGFAAVALNEKWGYIDKTGRVVIQLRYDEARQSSEGLFGVKLNEKFGFIDKTGKVVIPIKYKDAGNFSEGLAAVALDDNDITYKFIDKSGNFAMPGEYSSAGAFSEGLALVGLEDDERAKGTDEGFYIPNKFGFINRSGKVVVEIKYHDADDYSEGLAVVVKDDKQGFVDVSGREAVPLKYDVDECGCGRSSFAGGIAQVTLRGKFGFVDKRGREVVPVKYDDVWCVAFRKEGFIGVELNGKKGFVDLYGNEYFDF